MADILLPPNATPLERGLEQAMAVYGDARDPGIADLWRPETCPPALLPWLAWALSIRQWDAAWPVEVQRAAVAGAWAVHRRAGTLRVVEDVLEAAGAEYRLVEQGKAARRASLTVGAGSAAFVLTAQAAGLGGNDVSIELLLVAPVSAFDASVSGSTAGVLLAATLPAANGFRLVDAGDAARRLPDAVPADYIIGGGAAYITSFRITPIRVSLDLHPAPDDTGHGAGPQLTDAAESDLAFLLRAAGGQELTLRLSDLVADDSTEPYVWNAPSGADAAEYNAFRAAMDDGPVRLVLVDGSHPVVDVGARQVNSPEGPSVFVVDDAVQVFGRSGAPPTAAEVVAALRGFADAAALVAAVLGPGSDGSGTVDALSRTLLAGGADADDGGPGFRLRIEVVNSTALLGSGALAGLRDRVARVKRVSVHDTIVAAGAGLVGSLALIGAVGAVAVPPALNLRAGA